MILLLSGFLLFAMYRQVLRRQPNKLLAGKERHRAASTLY